MTSILDSDISKGIGQLFNEKQVRVPFYQRSYAWKKAQVIELYDDFRRAIDEGKDYYFLGSVVGCQSDAKAVEIEIVDGQQRLATTAILLAAIRDQLFDLGEPRQADKFEEQFLFHEKGLRDPVRRPTIRLNETDDDFFQERVMSSRAQTQLAVKPAKRQELRVPSHRLIDDAAKIAKSLVKEIVGTRNPSDQKGELDKWVNFIRDCARIIFIVVDDAADAFMIFETLNDRGLDLTVADLTKNYLFMKVGKENLPAAKTYWLQMSTTLAVSSDADITKVYIHHLWSSYNGVTRDKELFRDLREKYDNSTKALAFTKRLAESAPTYAAIGNSDSDFWNQYGRHAKRHLGILNSSLKVSQIRMMLLAVVDHFNCQDVESVLTCCVWWSVRLLIAGGQTGKWESLYARLAKDVRNRRIQNATSLINEMSGEIPSDEAFKAAFAEAEVTKAVGRYFLNCFESALRGLEAPHLAQDDPKLADREHIMPENPDKSHWSHLKPEDHERLCNRLGNHTLLTPAENKGRRNGPFADAKLVYGDSKFLMTQELAKHTGEWNEESIQKRQEKMANLAVRIWPIKPAKKSKTPNKSAKN